MRHLNHKISIGFILCIFVIDLFFCHKELNAYDVCSIYFQQNQSSSSRTVYLNDGNAWDLFQKYLDEAQKRKIKISPWKVKVVLVSNKERKEYSLNWIQMLTGQGAKERWAGLLKDVKADPDTNVYNEAVRQQWDMICYPRNVRGQTPPVPPDNPTLEAKQYFQQGMQYASRRDMSNAIKEFTNAIKKYPSYAAAYSNRGVAYMQQKKFDLAEDDLKKAVELGPKDGNNHYNLACWYSLRNQVGRGIASIDSALANGYSDYASLRKDPDLANLRKSADWQQVLYKHKIFIGTK